jgi:hypothetical protein
VFSLPSGRGPGALYDPILVIQRLELAMDSSSMLRNFFNNAQNAENVSLEEMEKTYDVQTLKTLVERFLVFL